jgi:2-polyprenyl-3-methyl-5-hydroxy-6-metoxy-1,4-benzoquinol methylase
MIMHMKLNDVDWETWRREKADFEPIMGQYQIQVLRDLCYGNSLLDIACGDGIITKGVSDKFT